MEEWALAHEARADAKARELITCLKACLPAGPALDERAGRRVHRVPRHPELARRAAAPGGHGRRPHVAQLHGGIAGDEREQLEAGFQADPTEHPVRILLATDAASEGIDLQRPLPPPGQLRHPVQPEPARAADRPHRPLRPADTHPRSATSSAPAGGHAVDAFEADLEFLRRVAREGRHDARTTSARSTPCSPTPCSGGWSASRSPWTSRRPTPGPARTPPGRHGRRPRAGPPARASSSTRPSPSWASPRRGCAGSWTPPWSWPGSRRCARTSATGTSTTGCSTSRRSPARGTGRPRGLAEKLETADRAPRQRPVTFDPAAAVHRDDVVLAHLNHPLVAMSTAAAASRGVAVGRRAAPGHRRAVATTLCWKTCSWARSPGSCSSARTVCGCTRRCCTPVAGCPSAAASGAGRTWARCAGCCPARWRTASRHRRTSTPGWRSAGRPSATACWPRSTGGRTPGERSLERVLAERAQEEQERIADRLDRFAHTLRRKLAEEDTDLGAGADQPG